LLGYSLMTKPWASLAREICAGDKAYDVTNVHFRLWEQGKNSALVPKGPW